MNRVILKRLFSSTPVLRSSHGQVRQTTLLDIYQLYHSKTPITTITAHDYISASMAEKSSVDVVLIGDSLAMTALGYPSTLEISFEEFYYQLKAVTRGIHSKFLICDLPYGSYESSVEKCIESSTKLMKLGKIQSIKLEGAFEYENHIKRLVEIGIPITGHIGLQPQKFNSFGGFKVQGSNVEDLVQIYKQALFLQKLGVSFLVLECIPTRIAQFITSKLSIPTIGIGAGNLTSGQVLVHSDTLGMLETDKSLKFVKPLAQFHQTGVEALNLYDKEVKESSYPERKYSYGIKDEVYAEFLKAAEHIK